MKKGILIIVIAITWLTSYSQTLLQADTINAKKGLKINGSKITGITNDSTLADNSQLNIATVYAVKNYILNHLSGGGGFAGVSAFNSRIGNVAPMVGDYSGFYQPLGNQLLNTFNYVNFQGIGISNSASTLRYIDLKTSGVLRWTHGAYSDAESGGNTGSSWYLRRYNDAGTSIDDVLGFNRPSGEGTVTHAFHGITASLSDNSDKFATTAFVKGQGYLTSIPSSGHIVPYSFINPKEAPYNAVGDGVADDYIPIQRAIDSAIANGITTVILPKGTYKISHPLIEYKWNGSAYQFFTLKLIGEGTFWQVDGFGPEIVTTYNNTFALGIQLGKGCTVKGIRFTGQYHVPSLTDYQFYSMSSPTQMQDGVSRNSRYSPFAAIVIDPFTYTAPPDGGYPGLTSYYRGGSGNGGSTGIETEDLFIANYCVGVICSPNNITNNAEEMRFIKTQFRDVIWGFVGCQDQEKANRVEGFYCWGDAYGIFTSGYGLYGVGTPGYWAFSNGNLAGRNRMLAYASCTNYFKTTFDNVYGERVGSVGDVNGCYLSNIQIDFEYFTTAGFQESYMNNYDGIVINSRFRFYGVQAKIPIRGNMTMTGVTFSGTPFNSNQQDPNEYQTFLNCDVIDAYGSKVFLGNKNKTASYGSYAYGISNANNTVTLSNQTYITFTSIVNGVSTVSLSNASSYAVGQTIHLQDHGFAMVTAISGSNVTFSYITPTTPDGSYYTFIVNDIFYTPSYQLVNGSGYYYYAPDANTTATAVLPNSTASTMIVGYFTKINVGDVLKLLITQGSVGSGTLSWTSYQYPIKWVGGTAPVLSTDANATDIIIFIYDGTNFIGAKIGGAGGGGGSATLQQVTDNGATTTNDIQMKSLTSLNRNGTSSTWAGLGVYPSQDNVGGYNTSALKGTSYFWAGHTGIEFANHAQKIYVNSPIEFHSDVAMGYVALGSVDAFDGGHDAVHIVNNNISSIRYASGTYPDFNISGKRVIIRAKSTAAWPDGAGGSAFGSIGVTVDDNKVYLGGAYTDNGSGADVQSSKLSTTHLIGATSTPTISVNSAAGTGATATLSSSSTDLAGKITVTTGTGASLVGNVLWATVTFNSAYGVAPNVILSNGGTSAGLTKSWAQGYTGNFTINLSSSTGISDNTTYIFYYTIIQ